MAQQQVNPYLATAQDLYGRSNPKREPPPSSNPYLDTARQTDDAQGVRMRVARRQADETTPDARANALKLAIETDLPVSVVERNFETLARRRGYEAVPFQEIQQQTPALAEWSTNPDNAAIAKDDMEQLGLVEWILKAPGYAFAQQINRGRYAELRVKSLFTPLTRDEADRMNSYKFNADRGGELGVGDSFFAKTVTGAARLLAQSIEPAKYGVVGGLEGLMIGGAAGTVLPGIGTAAGALATASYTARAGMMYGVFKSAAAQEAAGAYDEFTSLKDETGRTIDPDVARIAALTVGGLNGLVEQVGLEAFVKRFPGLDKLGRGLGRDAVKRALMNPTVRAGFARLAKSYAGGLSTEIATEVAQRAITIAGEELSIAASDTSLQQRSPVQVWDELVLEAVHAVPEFALGMLPGPVLGLARDANRAKQAEQGVAFFGALGEGTANSKTAQRMPGAFGQLVDEAVKDGPVATVYAPVDTWRTYWQDAGVDPAKMAAEVTGRTDAWDVAQRSGNLTIPTARYAATLAGTEHNAFLANELRLGTPDAMNGREMEEFRQKIDEARQRVQQAAKEETPEAKAIQAFAADIEQQLVERGNVPRGTAAVMAEALAGVGVLAQRAGYDPSHVFEAYGLTVQRRTAAEALAPGGGTIVGQTDPTDTGDETPGLEALEAALGGASVEAVDPATGATLGTETAAAADAQEGMQARGEQFVVYDRGGQRRVLLGPDAATYQAHEGETYGIEDSFGFRPLNNRGGRVPSVDAVRSRLGQQIGRILGQPQQLPPVPTGRRVEGELGPANTRGEQARFVGYQTGIGSMPTMALYNISGGERDGSTVGADELRELGITIPPTPPRLEFHQRAIANSPALRAWFGNSVVVDEDGQPLVVYHGTTQIFATFERERGNVESDFGAGFYFSNNPEDVAENYAGVGPDLTAKIERRAEQIAQERDREYDDPEAKALARAEMVAQEGLTMPVFLKIENPIVLGGPNETRLTYEYEYEPLSTFQASDIEELREQGLDDAEIQRELSDRNRYDPAERGTLIDAIKALRSVAADYYDTRGLDDAIAQLVDAGIDGGLTASRFIEIVRTNIGDASDDMGNIAGNEIIRRTFEHAGFDGIIDNTVDVKFGSQRRVGKAMAGMNEDTVHYIVFNPTQIKSAISNRGTFDPVDPNILFQSAALPPPAAQAFYSRLDRAVQDSKLKRATGAQWKATIRNARIGVNKDEFALARIDDLDDAAVHTKEEVLAYLKLNRPTVGVVVLEGKGEIDEDTLRERTVEIHDEMVDEAMQEVDWSEYLGDATYVEEETEEEVEKVDENGDPVLDEDGDPIYETVTRTVYYPAITGGMVKRQRGYGFEHRRRDEIIPDSEPHEDSDSAERTAQSYIDDIDRDEYWDYVYESVREGIDWSDAEDQARRELEDDPAHQTGGRYSEYQLEPEAEEDTYREAFITGGTVLKEAGGGAYEWQDGHDLYKDIENPIVRIRFNVRQTVGEGLPGIRTRGERVLFLEEVQPPSPRNQEKMPPIYVKNWREIAFKWALRHAAEEGLSAVAWTTGKQQADRYSLRRKVNKITSANITEDSPAWQAGYRKVVHVDLIQAPMLTMQIDEAGIVRNIINDFGNRWDNLKGQPLGAVIGEELAQQLIASETVIQGKGLLIGGEGLKKLYDYDFRNVVNALPAVKKHGGRVRTVLIPVNQEYEIETTPAGEAELAAHAQRVFGKPFAELTAEQQEEIRQTVPDKHRVMLEGDVVQEVSSRDAAFTWVQQNKVQPNEQPALLMTPELIDAVMGGQALFQAARYRPTTASEIDLLQQQVEAVAEKAVADAPSGSGLAVFMTPTGELHIDSIMVPTEEQGKGAGTAMMQAVLAWADEHNIQVSLVPGANPGKKTALERFYRRLGFVRNGTARFYDPGSYGSWVRPAKDDTPRRRRELQAQAGRPPRGMIAFAPNRKTTITLFETADLSTFLHETGHFYLELMGDLVDRLSVHDPATLTPQQQQLRADYATILNHLGVANRSEIDMPQHEKFARSFEAYLMEGRAPSPRLRAAFARFRAWLLGVYRSLQTLNAPLTADVRKVFDRMLATDAAIAEAEAYSRMTPMFTTPESAGMSHERFELYRESVAEASRTAQERLERKFMTEVQREQTEQWKARKAEVRSQVEKDTYAMPVYRAIAAMQRGTNPDGTALVDAPMKLSKAMLVESFGPERLRTIPKTLYTVEGGVDPAVVADLFGFSSADEMLQAVSAAQPMRKRITEETDRRMLLEHGSLLLDGTLHEQAQAAIADESRDVIVREELRALARLQEQTRAAEAGVRRDERAERAYERRWFEAEARLRIAIAEGRAQAEIDRLEEEVRRLKATARTGPAKVRGSLPSQQVLRDQARALIAGTKVRDLRPADYWAAARRASQAAVEAAAKQDFDAAILAKHQELISLALYRETVRAKEDIEARVRSAQQTGRPTSMAKLMIAGETYHDQVAGVLDRFEFAKVPQSALDRRAALWRWVQGQEAQGIPVELPTELLDEARRVNYQDLTVEELVGVTDGLKQLVHLARFKGRLLKHAERRSLKAVAERIAASVREHKSQRQKTVRDRRAGTERNRLVQGVLAAHRKLASLIREMDGFVDGGPLWTAIMRPLNEAGAREAEMNADATKRFAELIETAYPRSSKRSLYVKAFVPAVKQSLSKMERIAIALNYGNEGNRDRLRRAEGWSDEQIQAVLDTLDARDAVFVQGVFDFIGSYWDQIAAKQERVTGTRPEKVEAAPFRIVGTQMRGGYYPLRYDDRLSAAAAGQLDLEGANLQRLAAFAHATTKRGHTEARAATLDQPVRLDFGVMFEHVAQVIHDLTHHEALIDVGRVLGHKAVQTAIYETHGDIAYKTVKNTVRDIAYGDLPAANAFEKALNHTRTGATVVGLGWSASVAMLQPLGLMNSVVRIGPAAVGRGISRLLGSPARMNATVEWVYEKSSFMKTRARTQQRELNEIRNQVGVYSGKFSGIVDEMLAKTTFDTVTRQGIADSYFYFIQKMQQIVDLPTWLGAYDKGIRAGHDESTAVALADQAVLDSQGGGQVKDLAGVQRGGPAAKLFTNFYSYFSVVYNQAVESGKRAMVKRDAASIGRLAVDYMMLFIVPATLGYFIREGLRPGDDDDKSLTEALIVENLTYLMGMIVGVRELAGAVAGFEYQGPAGARIFSAGSRAIQQVRQGELDEAALRSLNEFSGLLFHYPAAQVWRTANGIAAFMEGKTENPAALIVGPETR